MATDEYGRTPTYAPSTPGDPELRKRILATPGRILVFRPKPPADAPAFVNDQPET